MKYLNLLLLPIRRNYRFFVFIFLLLMLCATVTGTGYRKAIFFDMYILCVLLSLLPYKIRLWVSGGIAALQYLTAIVDIYYFDNFGATLNPAVIMLLNETNFAEASNFLQTFMSVKVLFGHIAWILILLALHITAFVERKRISKLMHSLANKILSKIGRRKYQRCKAVMALLCAAITAWGGVEELPNNIGTLKMLGCKNMSELEVSFKMAPNRWYHMHTPVRRLYYSVLANHIASKQVVDVFRVTNGAQVDSCSFTVPNIILIIGESYIKAHSALYEYKMSTTPRQSALREKGELVVFDDVVTNKNSTSVVFKTMLATYVVGDTGTWSDTPLFPAIFRKAGYNVTFLSNEFTPDLKASASIFDVAGGFFLNPKDMSLLLFDYRNEKTFPYDEDLLDAYDRQFKKTERKNNLTIFHLIGQHVAYKNRYPENRAHFSAKDYTRFRPELTEEQRQAVAEYDNATLYNDSIVCEIVKRYSMKDAIVIYVPDHGEECYEGTRGYICRNPYPQMDWPKAHYEYEIPFWIYCSPKFREKHAELYQQIKEAKSRKFMTDALPHLLMYLGGIKTKWYKEKYNLISPHYWNDRPRMIDDAKYDYDKLRKNRK